MSYMKRAWETEHLSDPDYPHIEDEGEEAGRSAESARPASAVAPMERPVSLPAPACFVADDTEDAEHAA